MDIELKNMKERQDRYFSIMCGRCMGKMHVVYYIFMEDLEFFKPSNSVNAIEEFSNCEKKCLEEISCYDRYAKKVGEYSKKI